MMRPHLLLLAALLVTACQQQSQNAPVEKFSDDVNTRWLAGIRYAADNCEQVRLRTVKTTKNISNVYNIIMDEDDAESLCDIICSTEETIPTHQSDQKANFSNSILIEFLDENGNIMAACHQWDFACEGKEKKQDKHMGRCILEKDQYEEMREILQKATHPHQKD